MGSVRRYPGFLASGLALIISWPIGGVTPRAVAPRPHSPPALMAPSFAAHVVQALAALRPGTTPVAWLRAHPGDSLARFELRLAVENDHRWCARTLSRVGADPIPAGR